MARPDSATTRNSDGLFRCIWGVQFGTAERMDIVRNETGSAAAAALFGAILQAGFCLVIFPLTSAHHDRTNHQGSSLQRFPAREHD